ncbi:MAG: ATP-binding protein, partial [Bacteroidales bacterium]
SNTYQHFSNKQIGDKYISGNDILAVETGKNGDIWVGTYGNGLMRIQFFGGQNDFRISHYDHNPAGGLSSSYIRDIYIDDNGIVWIGTLGSGLDKLTPWNNEFVNYANVPGDTLSIHDNYINCIIEDRKGNLWIGLSNGLSKFDKTTKNFTHIKPGNEYLSDQISEIQEDNNGILWISTFRGLIRFDPSDSSNSHIINYTPKHGLQGNKFNVNASLKTKEGMMYFGGTTGFNLFDPSKIKINNYKPPVEITELRVNNEVARRGLDEQANSAIKELGIITDEIVLNHTARVLYFEFAALSYSMKERNRYAYMLEGLDDKWIYKGNQRNYATYGKLRPGDYVFKVKAANSDGIWNENPATFKIKVNPPPWQTWWAISGYFIIIAASLLIARNFTLSQANLRHKIKMEKLEKEKMEELNKMKLKFFTNISHELKTPLTLISGPLQKLMGEENIRIGYGDSLRIMERNVNRLMYLINQLMDFRKVETGNVDLSVSENDIYQSISIIKQAFDEFSERLKIHYEYLSNTGSLKVLIDEDKLQKMLYNLLSNAFKFTKEGGVIRVILFTPSKPGGPGMFDFIPSDETGNFYREVLESFNDKMDYIYISVVDSGIGISEDRIGKIFERFYQVSKAYPLRHVLNHTSTGIGLALTKDLVEIHHGEIDVKSKLDVGSCFTIKLPADMSIYSDEEVLYDGAPESLNVDSIPIGFLHDFG